MTANNLLLLTATITPKNKKKNLAITDPAVRLEQYKLALEYYLKMLSDGYIGGILFVDNSTSDCSSLVNLVEKYDVLDKVEIVSFYGLDYPDQYGRGFGEFKLIQYAMENSKLVASLGENDLIWKVTGRYILNNFQKILEEAPDNFDFYCNCRNYPISWIDLYALGWRKSCYSLLLDNIYLKLEEGDDTASSEEKFRVIIDNADSSLNIVRRFNITPNLIGYRGFDNQPYENGFKYTARKWMNRILPFIWI